MSFKKIATQVLSAFVIACTAAVVVHAPASSAMAYPDPIIPLLEPMPFPWDSIEGIWQGEIDGTEVLFSLDVRSDSGGRRFLHVAQLDAGTKLIVAEGSGFVDPKSGAVQAGMAGRFGSYMLFVGQYRNDKLSKYPKVVTVLTARSFQSLTQPFQTVISKVVSQPIRYFSAN